MKHISVLKKEAVDLLKVKKNGTYLDLTLGGGGHSLEILKKLEKGKLIVFDLDKNALDEFKQKVKEDKNEVHLINDNFENLEEVLSTLKIKKVDGILADLGWSVDQLESIEGLSFENLEQNLDMRFDKESGVKASDLLNVFGKKQLKKMFELYSDIKGKINDILVEEIIGQRSVSLITTVEDLNEIIKKVIYKSRSIDNEIKFKARVYQALRIATNNEYNNLTKMLDTSFSLLSENGRLVILTFHSGEEKIVTEFIDLKQKNKEGVLVSESNDKKYIQASVEELLENINSRSAKLFGIEKF